MVCLVGTIPSKCWTYRHRDKHQYTPPHSPQKKTNGKVAKRHLFHLAATKTVFGCRIVAALRPPDCRLWYHATHSLNGVLGLSALDPSRCSTCSNRYWLYHRSTGCLNNDGGHGATPQHGVILGTRKKHARAAPNCQHNISQKTQQSYATATHTENNAPERNAGKKTIACTAPESGGKNRAREVEVVHREGIPLVGSDAVTLKQDTSTNV